MIAPLCFVLAPFGKKKDPAGGPDIDFDRIYDAAIRPAATDAGLEPIRADEERVGGVIHKAMFERLLLSEFAVAELTTANANVFYELGVRHATRPRTTVSIFAKGQPIPFDVNYLRSIPYELGAGNVLEDASASTLRTALATRLRELRQMAQTEDNVDSPIFTLLKPYPGIDLPHLRAEAETFRARLRGADALRARIRSAQARGVSGSDRERARVELLDVEAELSDAVEMGVWVELYLALRAVDAFAEMIALYPRMPPELRATIMMREQLAFAHNRIGETTNDEAERAAALALLEDVRQQVGPNPETCGLIGRIHKTSWKRHLADNPAAAKGYLRKAIRAYVEGFEADWRDAYPGINALTLLASEGSDESAEELRRLLPVVRFSVEQRLRGRTPDYWDYATLLELAVHAGDERAARQHLEDALGVITDRFQPGTTADNLQMLQQNLRARNADLPWLDELIVQLRSAVSG